MGLPDINCTIKCVGPDGVNVADGDVVAMTGEGEVAVQIHVKNNSATATGPFVAKRVVSVDGAKVHDPPAEQLKLGPGATKTFTFSHDVGDVPERWTIKVLADVGNFVAEANEANNIAEMSFTIIDLFQMPFLYNQTWRASTYDGHYPNQNSLDLLRYEGGNDISLGQTVVASAGGKVVEAYDTNHEAKPYGSVVTIDHGAGWRTQYVHLADDLAVEKGDTVVRGQKIGTIGKFGDMAPHLHYVQWEDGKGVRVTFDSAQVKVHAGAKQPDGTYPTQELTSANRPIGVTTKQLDDGGHASCRKGAGLRAWVKCDFPIAGVKTLRGPWVGASVPSSVDCAGGAKASLVGFELS